MLKGRWIGEASGHVWLERRDQYVSIQVISHVKGKDDALNLQAEIIIYGFHSSDFPC
jgi:hypothetical protein